MTVLRGTKARIMIGLPSIEAALDVWFAGKTWRYESDAGGRAKLMQRAIYAAIDAAPLKTAAPAAKTTNDVKLTLQDRMAFSRFIARVIKVSTGFQHDMLLLDDVTRTTGSISSYIWALRAHADELEERLAKADAAHLADTHLKRFDGD